MVTDRGRGVDTPAPPERERQPILTADPLGLVVGRLPNPRRSGDGFTDRCPAHDDRSPSLSVGPGVDRAVVLRCFRDCPPEAILRALHFGDDEVRAILAARRDGTVSSASSSYRAQRSGPAGLTVAELARAKGLPEHELRAFGLRDAIGRRAVEIPYLDVTGRVLFVRTRTPSKTLQPAGIPLSPYGLDQLDAWRSADVRLMVEGESDCWTGRHHDVAVLGLPGANSAGSLQLDDVAGADRLYVVQEPDAGGPTFYTGIRKRLTELGWDGELYAIGLAYQGRRIKDLSDLHLAVGGDRPAFAEALAEAIAAAVLVDPEADQPTVWADEEEDLAAQLAAARARVAELEAMASIGSDGAEGCIACQERKAEEREQRTWDLMRKRGGWALNPATVIRSYARAAEAAISQGRATTALACEETSRLTGVSKPGITRTHHYLEALQRDPEIGPTLPFRIFRPEKPGDYHRPWWIAVNHDEQGQPIATTTSDMAEIFAKINLPKLNPDTQGDGSHGGARWRCPKAQHAEYGVIETVRRFFRCAAPGCSEQWEAALEVIPHGVPDQEEFHDETGPEDVQEALPLFATDEVEIGGDRYAVEVQGEDAGDQFHHETRSFHGDAPKSLTRRRHRETGPLIRVSMVSREDQELAAGPHYQGEAPPEDPLPPPEPAPLPIAPRSHIARAFRPRAIAGGDE